MQAPALSHSDLLSFWVQLFVLLLAARGLGAGARRMGQPAILGELSAGVLLGPSVLGALAPDVRAWLFPADPEQAALIGGVGWLGVFLLLVLIGLETDLDLVRRLRRAAAWVAGGSLLLPFGAGLVVGLALPEGFVGHATSRATFALFMATALCLSALPVIAKILADLDMLRRNIGQITLAAAMVNDVVGWTLLGVIAGLAERGSLGAIDLLWSVAGVLLFGLLAFTVGQRIVDSVLRSVRRRRAGVAGGIGVAVLIALAAGAGAQALGTEALLGAFIAGVVLGRSRFSDSEVLAHLETLTLSVIAPLYFATAGLHVDLGLLAQREVLWWGMIVLGVGCGSKLVGAWTGARLAGLGQREGLALGAGLNARGAVEIVVASVGLSLGVLNESSYTVVVLLAIATSLLAPPLLRAVLHGWRAGAEEGARLERERRLRANLLLKPQRLLLPSHGGPNSRLAARIVHAVWPEGVPATVLSAGTDVRPDEIDLVVSALEGRPVDYEHVSRGEPLKAILEHARLGYGAIAVGATDQKTTGALVSPVVDGLLAASPVPVIMVRASAAIDASAPLTFRRVLVPAIGTRPGRAAQEVAFALARRLSAEVILAHVVSAPAAFAGRGLEREEQLALAASVVEEARALASELGAHTVPAIATSGSVPEALLVLARSRGVDLIVLAANVRQASARPFLGHGVEHILEHSPIPVVVVTMAPG
jgi:Kef-type K+ transport system membrane component KefB/nucleotide-binding universal stress UspA family protein